jgi:hypothetical protein
MEYDGNIGMKIFVLISVAYVVGACIVGAIRYRFGARLGLVSLGVGLLVIAGMAIAMSGPIENQSERSWLSGVALVVLILGASWLGVGSVGLACGAVAARRTHKRDQEPR